MKITYYQKILLGKKYNSNDLEMKAFLLCCVPAFSCFGRFYNLQWRLLTAGSAGLKHFCVLLRIHYTPGCVSKLSVLAAQHLPCSLISICLILAYHTFYWKGLQYISNLPAVRLHCISADANLWRRGSSSAKMKDFFHPLRPQE